MSKTPPLQGGFFASVAISVAFGHQTKTATSGSQPRVNPRLRALNAQEDSREQREKNGGMRAWNGNFRRGVLKRPRHETAPTLVLRAKKIPTDKSWDFKYWWCITEPNPRPFSEQDSKTWL